MPVRVAVVGDYQPDHETHPATSAAVEHAGIALGVETEVSWVGTTDDESLASLRDFDGIWIAPGSPYRSLEGALRAIALARTEGIPLLGTCAGFQHIVIEFARNVIGDAEAQHAEYEPRASSLFVTPLSCSLAGRTFVVTIAAPSRASAAYGSATATERYYCNFGLNPDRESSIVDAGLSVTGRDDTGEARILEIPAHPFFVGTLFVPQVSSSPAAPHPLVTAFISSASAGSQGHRLDQREARGAKDP